MEPLRPSLPTLLGGVYLALQLAVPLVGLHPHRRPAFAPRFSWSMYAGPLTTHCAHRVDYTARDGTAVPFPLPPPDSPAHGILAARTPEAFSRASGVMIAYAATDEDVAHALDDLLRRYRQVIDPERQHVLVSTLDCNSPLGTPVHRVLRLDARP